jgi:hypothetical protein
MQKREGAFLQAPARPSYFWLSLLPFCFKRFFITFFSFQAKEKKRKPIEKNINAKKRKSLPSSSRSAHSLLAFAFGILFLPFRFKHFLLGIFFFSSKRKEKKT